MAFKEFLQIGWTSKTFFEFQPALIFGVVSIIPMFFMTFENKRRAMTASFITRFSIGFIIFNLPLQMPGWAKGD